MSKSKPKNNPKINTEVVVNAEDAGNTDAKVTDIVKKVCDLSLKIANYIKENKMTDDNDISDEFAVAIEAMYNERNLLISELKEMFDGGIITADLLKDNVQWNRYLNEIVLIEEANIQFLEAKTKEKKNKLNELFNNKSLMIYNKKVNLSYENRVL